MTLVNDNVTEVVHGIVRRQEVGGCIFVIHIERLVGCDEDSRILLRMSTRKRSCIVRERIVKRSRGLGAQLVAVANKQRSPKLSGIRNAAEQVDRSKSLARAR